MSSPYWYYFLSLERDFIRTLDFVDLAPANSDTYGDNFAKLILAIGSEVDVVCKAICEKLAPTAHPGKIFEYQQIISGHWPNMYHADVLVIRTGALITPWINWGLTNPISPDWWSDYNKVKHNRIVNITKATQDNALQALCGLLVINRYYHFVSTQLRPTPHPQPLPELLDSGAPTYAHFPPTRFLPHII